MITFYGLRKLIRKLPGVVIRWIPIPEPLIIEGHRSRAQIGNICKQAGYSKVLVITDTTLSALHFQDAIVQSLENENIQTTLFSDISTEPTVEIIEAGRQAALDCQAECIVAIGGGSVMDSSKMIAAGTRLYHRSVTSILRKFLFVKGKTLPLITIPSTAGTGAEMTVGAIVTNTKKKRKNSTVIIGLHISHVLLDSELTIKAPQKVTAACGIDALSHGLEGCVANVKVSQDDVLKSRECVKLVLQNLPTVLSKPDNIEARLAMCRAANYGGNAINKQLAGYVHAFAHTLGAQYHLPHGIAISISLLPVMEYQKQKILLPLANLAKYCGVASDEDSAENAANKLLQAIRHLIDQCQLDLNIAHASREDYPTLIKLIAKDSINYSAPVVLNDDKITMILDRIFENISA